jgi:NAD(P)-dependent dehydrogenase (short-subunit alcohol dehydrogenase family)
VPSRDLADAVTVITGAAGGLGSAMARSFAARGARLALLDVDETGLARLDGNALTRVCDLTDMEAVDSFFEDVTDRFGGVDILVNNAGMTHRSAFADTDPAVFRRVMAVNYLGAVNATKAALPSIVQRQGAIVAISSVAGFGPLLGRTGYAASKHAIHGLFESLRAELTGTGVDVSIVAPSFVDTPLRYHTLGGDGSITTHPQSRVGRMLPPDRVADAVVGAVEQRRRFVTVGTVGKASWILNRVSPRLYEWIMTRSLASELDRGNG